jgi:uncharacterized protein
MGRPVVHFEINANDSKRLGSFFAELFDWKIDTNNPMGYGLVDTGGEGGIGGSIGQSDGNAPAYLSVYVQVDDLQAYLDKAEKLGGKTLVPPTEIPNTVTFAMFQDPEGNMIGLIKG